jgi:hypothetical protein
MSMPFARFGAGFLDGKSAGFALGGPRSCGAGCVILCGPRTPGALVAGLLNERRCCRTEARELPDLFERSRCGSRGGSREQFASLLSSARLGFPRNRRIDPQQSRPRSRDSPRVVWSRGLRGVARPKGGRSDEEFRRPPSGGEGLGRSRLHRAGSIQGSPARGLRPLRVRW